MGKKDIAKAKKELERRFGKLHESMVGYHDHIDFRSLDDFDDDAFAWLMQNVKGVNMLDLNETDISNDSISLLGKLEYVKELRAKGCHNLNNDCVDDLNKLTSLVFLHLKNTNITIDGLLKLKNLSNLKTLMFSADDPVSIKEKLLQLKTMLPGCELVINSKPYYCDSIDLFIHALKTKPFRYRLKIKNTPITANWSSWLGQPGDNNIEAEVQGMYPLGEIEWVEIDPIERRIEGEPIATKENDHSAGIMKLLEDVKFPFMVSDCVISAYMFRKEI
jgi:hypothetical protein